MKKLQFHPESLMMSYGVNPKNVNGSIKTPLYQTSTFEFESAEEGKAFFEIAYGLRESKEGEELGMIYSRIDNPNVSVTEKRLALYDKAENAALFSSGMAAISTVFLEFLKPGDILLYTDPLYGGTMHFIDHILPELGIRTISIDSRKSVNGQLNELTKQGICKNVKMIYLETPANPTMELVDIEKMALLSDSLGNLNEKPLVVVDNTYMGPIWQKPFEHGADLVLYSATKYLGGHSDLIAGVIVGPNDLIAAAKSRRAFLGNMADPHTAWLLARSLETLQLRMEKQAKNAEMIADFLNQHPLVRNIEYLGMLEAGSRQEHIFKKQCKSPGAMISFNIQGGEREAFKFLDSLRLFKLAVSLGSTESLAQHPKTMTHAGINHDRQLALGITNNLIRLSIGVENPNDLIRDLHLALNEVNKVDKGYSSKKMKQKVSILQPIK